jgi:uncharacterized membrane protein YphA (DoxX/SURF4 family)
MWYNETIAILVARVILGILFFAQGYDKVFNVRLDGVIATFRQPMGSKQIPDFILTLSAYYTSYIELIGGLLLIIGFAKIYVLALLGLDLILVAAAFSIMKPMWDMQYFFPRLALLIFLLLVPAGWDVFSLDYIIGFVKAVTP